MIVRATVRLKLLAHAQAAASSSAEFLVFLSRPADHHVVRTQGVPIGKEHGISQLSAFSRCHRNRFACTVQQRPAPMIAHKARQRSTQIDNFLTPFGNFIAFNAPMISLKYLWFCALTRQKEE
jgi:hypothetical protein